MTTIQVKTEEYFGGLNSMTRKLRQEKKNFQKAYGNEWASLTTEEQEILFENHIILPEVREKYQCETSEVRPEVFPKMKINCGEKVVVDFENEDVSIYTLYYYNKLILINHVNL